MSLAAAYLLGAQRVPGSQGPEKDPRVDEMMPSDPLAAIRSELDHGDLDAARFRGELEGHYQTERTERRPALLKTWLKLWNIGQTAVAIGALVALQGLDLAAGPVLAFVSFALGALALPLSWTNRPQLLLGATAGLVGGGALLQVLLLALVFRSDEAAPLALILAPLVSLALLAASPLPKRWNRIAVNGLTAGAVLAQVIALPGRDALVAVAGTLSLRVLTGHVQARLSRLHRESFLLRRQAQLQAEQRQAERTAMERLARMDALTGIANRRAFDTCLVEHLTRARPSRPLAVALLDIDYFKALNDSAGHLSGDECLRRVATALRKAADHAFVARYGGEEFAILLELAEGDDPLQRLDALRAAVIDLSISHPGRPGEFVTISIGGTMAVEAENSRVVLDRADTALYRAKAQGRNRVEFEVKGPARSADTASLKRLLEMAQSSRGNPPPSAQRGSA